MDLNETFVCPKCKGKNFIVKREATYLYTYKFSTDNIEEINKKSREFPFLFDNREKETSNEYLECEECGTKYPIDLDSIGYKIDFTILRKAVRGDTVENPEFLG